MDKKNYSQICEEFNWADVMAYCDWNPAERFNIAHEVCDRHAREPNRVACLLPKVPELLVTVLATLKAGAVYIPLFTAFGPKAIQYRLNHSKTAVVVINSEYRPVLSGISGGGGTG